MGAPFRQKIIKMSPSIHYQQTQQGGKQWIAAIGRETIPASGRLCSDHFTSDCYEESSSLKFTLCPELYTNRKNMRRKLKRNAMPTIFSHMQPIKERKTSVQRSERTKQAEVSIFFIIRPVMHKKHTV